MNRLLFLATGLLALGTVGTLAQNLPTGGEVVAGTAGIVTSSDQMRVDQSTDKAIINWNTFDIGEGYRVVFVQPSESSVTLNRVMGGKPSDILGRLDANGILMLVNPDGILFGRNSEIDVGSLVATTHDLVDGDFLAGDYNFSLAGNPSASIINLGTITARDSGIAAFVAPGVRNEGLIQARLGKVALASGNRFSLDLYGDSLIKLAVEDEILSEVIDLSTGQPLRTHVDNQGTLSANGGSVALTAVTARRVVDQVINNEGLIEATTVGSRNGKIVLGAAAASTKTPQSPGQKVLVSGDLIATGDDAGEFGGKVLITGELLRLTHANIDASGMAGGGTVLVGGDYLGGRADDQTLAKLGISREGNRPDTARLVWVEAGTDIDASAVDTGSGGKVVLWSDGLTHLSGSIRAMGGASAGDGGFVEVSGAQILQYSGDVVTAAQAGQNGTLLLDPSKLYIVGSDTVNVGLTNDTLNNAWAFIPSTFDATTSELLTGGVSYLSASDIEEMLLTNNVSISAALLYAVRDPDTDEISYPRDGADIYVNAPIVMPNTGNTLSFYLLLDGGSIRVNSTIDMRQSTGGLRFYGGFFGYSKLMGAGTILANSEAISIAYFDDVGSIDSPLKVEIVPDSDATPQTANSCPHVGACSDTGTKFQFHNIELSTWAERIFIQGLSNRSVPSDPDPGTEEPEVPNPPDDPQLTGLSPEQLDRYRAAELSIDDIEPAAGTEVDAYGKLAEIGSQGREAIKRLGYSPEALAEELISRLAGKPEDVDVPPTGPKAVVAMLNGLHVSLWADWSLKLVRESMKVNHSLEFSEDTDPNHSQFGIEMEKKEADRWLAN